MFTIKDLRQLGYDALTDLYDHGRIDSDLLLMHVLNIDKLDLITASDKSVAVKDVEIFKAYLERLKRKEPIQYILGIQAFMGLEFVVKPGVLIPRQDTETLVELLLEKYKKESGLKILELGLGSGAIALSLGHFLKDACLYGVDIDDIPIEVTKENSQRLGVAIEVMQGDLFEPVAFEHKESFDLIVSNPPYISEEEMTELETNVMDYEPHLALCGGVKGHEFYERIVPMALKFLKENGTLAFEIGYNQGEVVKELMLRYGYRDVVIVKDLAGKDRVVMGCKGIEV